MHFQFFFLVLAKFLDVEHLISLCIQVPKKDDIKSAETRITEIIYLKHTLELVEPLKQALADGEQPLFTMYAKVSCAFLCFYSRSLRLFMLLYKQSYIFIFPVFRRRSISFIIGDHIFSDQWRNNVSKRNFEYENTKSISYKGEHP